jgi:hypothetical protein
MSIIPKETIQVIAQSIGIHALPDEVASALAPEVEYRMREIMQVSCPLPSPRPFSSAFFFASLGFSLSRF